MKKVLLLLVAAVAAVPNVRAEEGMWTYNNFPAQVVKQKYGFAPTQEWLDHARLSSVRFGNGCSASFVSPNGLIMTNHHCARSCIQNLSSAQNNYIDKGFYASTQDAEKRCPGLEVNVLTSIKDVTADVNAATKGASGAAYTEALDSVKAKLEKGCTSGDTTKCEVVTLYSGGRYNLYQYRRFDDVRLVFAPEEAIAFFGGDPDNFNFPRYDYDVTFVRAYEDGAPAKVEHYFKWSPTGANDGTLTFVSGHPGRTEREQTVAQLEYSRDYALPRIIAHYSELRGMLNQFQTRGPEQARISNSQLFGTENSLKVYKGRQEALVDRAAMARKVAHEQELRQKVEADPKLKAQYGQVWNAIATAVARQRALDPAFLYIELGRGFNSRLFTNAITLVRAADELEKPNEKRLPAYVDSKLPSLRQSIASTAPIYDELEIETLTFSLTKLREVLGPDDAFVRNVFGKRSPREIATEAVAGTKLKDPAVRKQLLAGGKSALEGVAADPMIKLARTVDPYGRELRKNYEQQVESVLKKNGELLGKARFAVYGMSIYPDATSTLRLSYGSVKGWTENGRPVAPFTIIGGAYERNTGRDPFRLPESWMAAKEKLNQQTPFNFVTTNDIIGGNSGSPMIDQKAEVIGLIFDGNIHSLGGDYYFEPLMNRTVAVDSRVLLEALEKVYGATRVLDEIKPKS